MRARNIKPGFFKNEDLAECSFPARILFIGLWCLADWTGRMEYRPKKITVELFPYDAGIDIPSLIGELVSHGFVHLYGNDKYLEILRFTNHQNPHKNEEKTPSRLPCPSSFGFDTEQVPSRNGTAPADSLFLIPDSLIPDTPQSEQNGAIAPTGKVSGISSQEKTDRQKIIDSYNHHATKTKYWKKFTSNKESSSLLSERIKDKDFMETLDFYFAKVVQLDWPNVKSVVFCLRRQTFDMVMSGEWRPGGKSKAIEEPSNPTTERLIKQVQESLNKKG